MQDTVKLGVDLLELLLELELLLLELLELLQLPLLLLRGQLLQDTVKVGVGLRGVGGRVAARRDGAGALGVGGRSGR